MALNVIPTPHFKTSHSESLNLQNEVPSTLLSLSCTAAARPQHLWLGSRMYRTVTEVDRHLAGWSVDAVAEEEWEDVLMRGQLTPCSGVLFAELLVPRPAKKFTAYYGAESSLPCLQKPTTCSYPEWDEISTHVPPYFFKIITGRTYTEIQKNVSVNGSLFCPICI